MNNVNCMDYYSFDHMLVSVDLSLEGWVMEIYLVTPENSTPVNVVDLL